VTGRSALRFFVPLAALGGLLAGCSDDSALGRTTTTAPPATDAGGGQLPGSGTTVEIDAFDNRFEPMALTVAPGTTVRFANRGRNDHNVVPETGDDWGVAQTDFGPGADYTHVFDTPGTYQYVCTIHGVITNGKAVGMVGRIEVTAA